ncbi:unnamed protein product [Arctia plantaginis]|uniref:Uncharacterized protein n=1 Tax=Arctia plantaginis TaxID=874455 RepID=A0A8S1B944_ARCPL|nr:unnamed protein product [Arctia plantaginis]
MAANENFLLCPCLENTPCDHSVFCDTLPNRHACVRVFLASSFVNGEDMAQKQRACDIIGQALRNSQQIKLQKIRKKIYFDVQPDEDINRYKQNSFSKVSNDVKDFDVNENSEPTSSSNLDDLNQSKNYLLGDKNDGCHHFYLQVNNFLSL